MLPPSILKSLHSKKENKRRNKGIFWRGTDWKGQNSLALTVVDKKLQFSHGMF